MDDSCFRPTTSLVPFFRSSSTFVEHSSLCLTVLQLNGIDNVVVIVYGRSGLMNAIYILRYLRTGNQLMYNLDPRCSTGLTRMHNKDRAKCIHIYSHTWFSPLSIRLPSSQILLSASREPEIDATKHSYIAGIRIGARQGREKRTTK